MFKYLLANSYKIKVKKQEKSTYVVTDCLMSELQEYHWFNNLSNF